MNKKNRQKHIIKITGGHRGPPLPGILIIFIFPFFIYNNSLNNGFLAGDDEGITLRNQYLRDWKYLPKFFTENYKAGSGEITNFWRPFQLLTYSFIIHTAGFKPWAFHLSSILFHALCGIMLFLILLRLAPQKIPLSAITAVVLIWLAHPIHNSEIAVTSGIASPSHLFWMLCGLYTFMRFEEKGTWAYYFLSLISFIVSLWCKESAVIFPGLLLAVHITGTRTGIFKKTKPGHFLPVHLPFWLIAFFYVFARGTFLNFENSFNFYNQANLWTENLSYRLLTLSTILVHGLRIIFIPLGIHPERAWPVFTEFSWRVSGSIAILAIIVGAAIRLWKRNPLFTLGIFWFFCSYLPMSNIAAQIHSLVWDHWFYTPSIGILLSGLSLLPASFPVKKLSALFWLSPIIALSILTLSKNPFWRDTESVSRFILSYEPRSAKTWNNLAMALMDKGQHEEAVNCYLKAISISDVYPQTHHNLANAYMDRKEYTLAEREYLKALGIDSKFYYSHIKLGELYLAQGKKQEALQHLKKAVEIYPYLPGIKEFLTKANQ
ncbi:MAG: tetratricopeptide repeat protein [Candidatus Omnitrophota bacterium]